MSDPFEVVRDFEFALADYAGAPYCVSVTSCTMALLLAVAWNFRNVHPSHRHEYNVAGWMNRREINIPKRTYVGVPMSIIHAGGRPTFRDEDWVGEYQLKPLPIWDSARRLSRGMYRKGQMQCVSFHTSKILGDTQGGAILLDDDLADRWLRMARFDGRTEGVPAGRDAITVLGWHCYLSPDVAARLLWKLTHLPSQNPDLPNSDYPDLSTMEIFR